MATEKRLIYAVRDTETGELVNYIASHSRMFWTRYAFAENAVLAFNKRKSKPKHGKLEIVEFALDEVAAYAID